MIQYKVLKGIYACSFILLQMGNITTVMYNGLSAYQKMMDEEVT